MVVLRMLGVIVLLTGCTGEDLPPPVNSEGLSQEARVEYIAALIMLEGRLPGAVIDAHYVEVRDDDGGVEFFARIDIDPSDQSRWVTALAERGSDVGYNAPTPQPDWWVGEAEFGASTLYSSDLFDRPLGWTCMGRNGKRLWVYQSSG